jgi:cytoskeletal protein RodZ
VSIGEDLAEARRRAGLTVTEVSQRTRIRETIISAIERDDYAGCGGDFYARGDIRSIARAVGTDPEPMIQDYDAAHRSPEVSAADLFRSVTPAGLAERRRVNWTAVLAVALVLVVGFAGYHILSASGHAALARHHRGAAGRPATPTTPGVPARPGHQIVVQVTAVQDCWVEFTTLGGRYLFQAYVVAGSSRHWTFARAVDMRLGNPGGVRLLVDGQNPLPPGTTHPVTVRLGQ